MTPAEFDALFDTVDLFSGPGGWSQAARLLGLREHGIDFSADACATARAAGHYRQHADISQLNPADYGHPRGLIGSPPCQGFSMAGQGGSRNDADIIMGVLWDIVDGADVTERVAALREFATDKHSALVLEPLKWALTLRPQWIAWEQTALVQPIWDECAKILRRYGYGVWTGVVSAEQYGVPQTRKRAMLTARQGASDADVQMHPTHERYRPAGRVAAVVEPSLFDEPLKPWVSMREALGSEWVPDFFSQTGTAVDEQWPDKRPSTTVAGRALVQNPGATANRFNGSTKSRNDGIRLSQRDRSLIQTFPADYPWQGTKSSQETQVGDAVPPLLAEAALRAASGITTEAELVCIGCGDNLAVDRYMHCLDCLDTEVS